MKSFQNNKYIQMLIQLLLIASMVSLYMQDDVKQVVFAGFASKALFGLTWVMLISNLIFLFMDFRYIQKSKNQYHSLYNAAYSDTLSGMPNRFSCDTIIEKYEDSILPDQVSCLVIDMTNLFEINNRYSHAIGNRQLKTFSLILSQAAQGLCFIGRNGGNKFLGIFESGGEAEIELFLERVRDQVDSHNRVKENVPIEYKSGVAMNRREKQRSITKLISLANSRVYEENGM